MEGGAPLTPFHVSVDAFRVLLGGRAPFATRLE